MRAVVNATSLRPDGAGTSTYARELIRALGRREDVDQLTAIVQRDAVGELPASAVVRPVRITSGIARAFINKAIQVPPVDVFHGLDVDVPLRVPKQTATIATIHDLAVFDVPWAFTKLRARGEQALARDTARRADALIAVSPFTAERVKHWLRREAEVVPLAPSPDLRPAEDLEMQQIVTKYDLPGVFALHVGTVEPRKDVWRLADACRRVGVPLYLAGAQWKGGIPLPAGLHSLGFVPRSDLAPLYAAATVVAYPSLYEGFGLPPVEAMACGGAVLCSRVASLPQLVGDGARWFPPGDLDALEAALREVLLDADLQRELRRRGRAAAAALSFDAVADQTVAIWRHAR